MKIKFSFLLTVAAFAAITALAFTGCGEGLEIYTVGTEANLTGVTIGSAYVSQVPPPIDGLVFDDDEENITDAASEIAPLNRSSDIANVRLRPNVSKGARVEWGIGTQDMRPFGFYDVRVLATLNDGDFVYFKVTSEDKEITNYYRYNIWVRSPVVELSDVYIGDYETHEWTDPNGNGNPTTIVDKDERMLAVLANPSSSLSAVMTASPGTIDIMTNQRTNAEVVVVPYDASATLRYAVTTNNTAKPSFGNSNTFTLADQNYLYVEVTAQNTVDIAYYKLLVNVGRIATLKSVTFVGTSSVKFGVANKGVPSTAYPSSVPGKFETADMPNAGFGLEFELDDPAAKCSYIIYSASSAGTPTTFPGMSGGANSFLFDGTNRLVLRVISDNNQRIFYYKIDVVLLAANFAKHPKSDYYYYYNNSTMVGSATKGDQVTWYTYAAKLFTGYTLQSSNPLFTSKGESTVANLSATLDRPITGSYEWYECNSWYGGYGFDADGRILYYPQGVQEEAKEDGFTADSYHVDGFDEKKNVSFHNGGNQYYRLENPGRKLTGTGASGTLANTSTVPGPKPDINKRPFIDGFTSETHYYWVVVTDSVTGRKAVSKRAAIVSERDPRKKHHIINLTEDNYLGTPGNEGYETAPAKNANVFTYQRETYKIPVTFPAGFNINDYTVATVQALFWLRDGTPWIQNWTQGDVGFEDSDGARVIYYNLTNNNGTLGLVGGGKEPGGGSVTATPKYLIVKPAGEKPISQLPPFNPDGTPQNNNNAQGWFTGFIELVEVRFEGPARE
jgi:hypothetical protein